MRTPTLLLALLLGLGAGPAAASALDGPAVQPQRVLARFRAPDNPYAPGHRGTDVAAVPGQTVLSPLAGHISFVGEVAGRPVTVISAGRRRLSLEPVSSDLPLGAPVALGQALGRAGWGGHCAGRCVHLGMRINGVYVDPLRGRAHLLP
ncbi:MAG: peptidoglycan DD-metalloendopeptidase family protein [Candidatus Nanopelagicales bacterium]